MKTMSWTLRLAVGTAAMLALMSAVAQADPSAYVGTYRPSPVVTLAPEGSALSAGLAPEMVAPRTTASARNGMYRRKRRTTGGISMSPFFRASVAAVLCAPSRA